MDVKNLVDKERLVKDFAELSHLDWDLPGALNFVKLTRIAKLMLVKTGYTGSWMLTVPVWNLVCLQVGRWKGPISVFGGSEFFVFSVNTEP